MTYDYCKEPHCGEGELDHPTPKQIIENSWECHLCGNVQSVPNRDDLYESLLLTLVEEVEKLKQKVHHLSNQYI